MAVTAAVVEEVSTAAAAVVSTAVEVVVVSMEAAAMAAAVSAAAHPPMAAIVAAASQAVAGQEACAADFRPRHAVPAQAGLGPSRVGEAAAAWPDLADRGLPTGSGTPSAALTVRSEQQFDPLQASIVAALSHPRLGAVEIGAAGVSAGAAAGVGVVVGDGADAGVGAAGAAVGDLAWVSAGLPFGIGRRTGTAPGWITIIPGRMSTRSLCGREQGYFAGRVVAVTSSRMLSINRVLPT
jgi:hypothetical protein